MPTRKGPATTEGILGTQDERLRALETHQHDELTASSNGARGKEYATVIIAGYDSHPSGRDKADLQSSGGSDETTILEAINKLPVIGGIARGRIELLEGTYRFQSNCVLPGLTDVEICGMGSGTRIEVVNSVVTKAFSLVGCTGVKIRDLAFIDTLGDTGGDIQAIDVDGTCVDCDLEQLQFEGFFGDNAACYIQFGAQRIRMLNCTAKDTENGFELDGTDCDLVNCYAVNVLGGTGFVLQGDRNQATACRGIGGDESMNAHFVVGGVSDRGSLIGCYSVDSGYRGIVVQGPETIVSGCHVENVASSILGGIFISGAPRSVITGNHVRGGTDNGIGVLDVNTDPNDILIEGNSIYLCGQHGISLDGALKGVSVLGNRVLQCGQTTNVTYDGIHIRDNSDECNVQGNTIRHGGGAAQHRYGINVATSDCNDNLVTNNDLLTSGSTGSFNDAGTGTITTAGNRL